MARLGADGSVCVFSQVAAEVILDATGWLGGTGAASSAWPPSGSSTPARARAPYTVSIKARVQPGAPPWCRSGPAPACPAASNAVALNVTVVAPSVAGFLTAHPCDAPAPTSNVNYVAGDIRPNLVLVRSDANDRVCLSTLQPTDVVVDLLGYFA